MALKLQINIPVTLSLTRPDPKIYTHEGGRQSYMYSITYPDGKPDKAFLTPGCSETIQQMGIQPREQFTICRRKTPQGAEYFEVHTCANSDRSGKVALPATAEQPQPKPAGRAHVASSPMGSALIAAFDAARILEDYAASKGIALKFSAEDVRAIANTLFIQACRDSLAGDRAA